MAPKEKHGRVHKKPRKKRNLHALSFKQKQHLKEYGELHPSEARDDGNEHYTQIKDDKENEEKMVESSESEEEVETESQHPFQELLSTFGEKESHSLDYKSSSEEEEEMDNEEEGLGDDEDAELEGEDEDISVAEDEDNDLENEEDDLGDIENGDDDDNDEETDNDEADDEDEGEVEEEGDNKELSPNEEEVEDDSFEFPEIKDVEIDDKEVLEENDDKDNFTVQDTDPFSVHFEKDVDDKIINKIKNNEKWIKENVKVPGLGKAQISYIDKSVLPTTDYKETDLTKLHIQEKLQKKIPETNSTLCNIQTGELSPLQQGLFNILNNYQDVYYSERSHHNQEEIRLAYCLHLLNHIVKSRNQVIGNNTKIKDQKSSVDEDYRDQGLTRPKVLILVPFRESAYKIVNILISLITTGKKAKMMNRKRFVQEYHEEDEEDKKKVKPEDFDALFAGNIDDHFRFGVQISKSVIKLFSHFYMSDLIIASPLGLRTIIGTEGEKGDSDFLSSIELLIVDQADVFLLQNWDHVMQIMKKMHLQPKDGHGVDFSRVRMWTLEGWSKYYRQTAVFSSISSPEITALFNKHSHNYSGKIQILRKPSSGSICHIVTQLPQTFHRFNCKNFSQVCDDRFNFFVEKILPNIQDHMKKHTMVFIPSYFDFVRIRNYFAKEEMNFVQMNEYVKEDKLSKYRWLFFVGKVPFMLYTERLHFYRRYRVRGIHHLVFYELPHYAHYYSELCNMLQDPKRNMDNVELTCSVIYCKYDAQKLAETIGTERASVMINSEKSVHMFVTGENS